MSLQGNGFLGNQNLLAYGAVLPFGQARFGAGGFFRGVGYFRVSLQGNGFLGDQNLLAYGAMLSFGQARFGAGGILRGVGYFRVAVGGDGIDLNDGSVFRTIYFFSVLRAGSRDGLNKAYFSAKLADFTNSANSAGMRHLPVRRIQRPFIPGVNIVWAYHSVHRHGFLHFANLAPADHFSDPRIHFPIAPCMHIIRAENIV